MPIRPHSLIGTKLEPPAKPEPVGKAQAKKPGDPKGRFRLIVRFWQSPRTVELSPFAKLAWLYMWMLAGRDRTCYPSVGRVARTVGCSTRHARRAIGELKDAEYLAVLSPGTSRGRKMANTYRIGVPTRASDGAEL